MRGILLDTHIWFWYLIGSRRLPRGLRTAIDTQQDQCWLSPISVWELNMLAQRGRIRIEGDFRTWFVQAQRKLPLQEARLTTEVALVSQEMELSHRDPADHFLAATALVYELTLLTVDKHLIQAKWLATQAS